MILSFASHNAIHNDSFTLFFSFNTKVPIDTIGLSEKGNYAKVCESSPDIPQWVARDVHNKYARGGARERAHVREGRAVKHLLTSLPASPLMDLPAFKVLNTIIPQIFFPLSASTPQISEIYQVQISLNFHL